LAHSQLFFKSHNEPLSILNIIVGFIYKTIYKIYFKVSSKCGGEWKLGLKICTWHVVLVVVSLSSCSYGKTPKKRKGKESKRSLLKFVSIQFVSTKIQIWLPGILI
jgi:hypothetical protein